jgi:predicted alpha/beta superfamily hydrolase
MKRAIHLHFSLFFFTVVSFAASAQPWPGIKDSLYSKAIGETRKFQVVLPKDYVQGSATKYEVLYMPDGEWYMEQIPFIYNFVANAHYGPQNIFVLIPNTYVNGVNIRNRDYSPIHVPFDSISGGADNYHKFLKEELIPYVEQKYPANGQRTLVGSSFSGLFALYAFFKDPDLFNSFVASDPNASFGDMYVPHMAAEKLSSFDKVKSTLFFAGLQISSRGMGSFQLDSIMKAKAPKSLRWKYVEYADETHYSVQHKAFYDGMRFSHLGYTTEVPVIHPMAGVLVNGKPIQLFILNNPASFHYTTDNSTPSIDAETLKAQVTIPGPCHLKAQSFPNREMDMRTLDVNYQAGPITLTRAKAKTTSLSYALYEGTWTTLPDVRKMKPTKEGTWTKDTMLGKLKSKKDADAAYVVKGTLQIEESGYYIFAAFGGDAAKATVAGQTFFNVGDFDGKEGRSYVLPLDKGVYPFQVELLRKSSSPEVSFSIFKSSSPEQRWWEQRIMGF